MNLTELYESIDLEYIRRCVAEKMIETEMLDFKEAKSQSGPMHKEDKRNLSKALSAFANADGGIIIWGVEARPSRQDEPDAAEELKPIANLKRFLSDLNTLSPQLASPFLEGVRHKLVLEDGQTDSGYAVSLIPEAVNEPIMATGSDLHRYYCRANANFMTMSHTMVADRFNRITKPDLRICITFCPANGSLGDRMFVGLANVGLGIALYPAVSFGPRYRIPVGDCYPLQSSLGASPIASLDMQNGQVFQAESGIVIHPKTMLNFLRWDKHLPTDPADQIYADFEVFASGYYNKGTFYTTLEEVLKAQPGFTMGTVADQADVILKPRTAPQTI